jgi:hypothetical protein
LKTATQKQTDFCAIHAKLKDYGLMSQLQVMEFAKLAEQRILTK